MNLRRPERAGEATFNRPPRAIRVRPGRRRAGIAPPGNGEETSRWFSFLTQFIAPTSALVALLYYFGVVRTRALYQYFGIDADVLRISYSGYVFRSAEAIWPIALSFGLLAIICVWFDHLSLRLLVDDRHDRTALVVSVLCGIFGTLLVVAAIAASVWPLTDPLVPPLGCALGLLLWIYAVRVSARSGRLGMAASVRVPRHQRRETAILAIVLVLTLFWTTARLAEGLGRGRAQELERSGFASVPDVTLYTPAPLSIQAKDISVTDLGAGLGARRYRYEGFKLLVRGEGRLLLIPYSWSTTNAYAYVLPDDDSLLIVFTPVF